MSGVIGVPDVYRRLDGLEHRLDQLEHSVEQLRDSQVRVVSVVNEDLGMRHLSLMRESAPKAAPSEVEGPEAGGRLKGSSGGRPR